MTSALPGVEIGHWSDPAARTGCTVVLFPEGTVASGEVRGGAPATREWALLEPHRTVARIDAVVLSGGSAFGLGACDGVMRYCEERGRGHPTPAGVVPIVVGACLYDLTVGDPTIRPGPEDGYAACLAALDGQVAAGAVGAGTGATVGKWRGLEHARPGGVGTAVARLGDAVLEAVMAVNAYGDLGPAPDPGELVPAPPLANTTIGVVTTNARLDKVQCLLMAQSAHDGLARALSPVHASVDGDAVVAASLGSGGRVEVSLEALRMLAAAAAEDAVRAGAAGPDAGPGAGDTAGRR